MALAIKTYVEQWAARRVSPSGSQAPSAADEIRKLKALLDEGILIRSSTPRNVNCSDCDCGGINLVAVEVEIRCNTMTTTSGAAPKAV